MLEASSRNAKDMTSTKTVVPGCGVQLYWSCTIRRVEVLLAQDVLKSDSVVSVTTEPEQMKLRSSQSCLPGRFCAMRAVKGRGRECPEIEARTCAAFENQLFNSAHCTYFVWW
jgi:hypothetical protein